MAGDTSVRTPVQLAHPIRGSADDQRTASALPGFSRFDPGVFDQDPFGGVKIFDRAAADGFGQFAEDHRRLLHRHPLDHAAAAVVREGVLDRRSGRGDQRGKLRWRPVPSDPVRSR